MRRHRRGPTLAAVIALSTGISAAHAQGLAVFDPLNYQQNLLTAVRALENLQNQVRLLEGQAQQLLRMDQNLQPLRGSVGGDLQSTLAQLRARIGEGDALALKVRETDAALERLYPARFSEALSSDELVRGARSRWEEAHASFRRAAALQAQVSETVDGDGHLLDGTLRRSQSAVGALQVAQAGNELAALNVKQALQLQALLAVQHRAENADRLRGVVAEEEARTRFKAFVGNARAYTPGR
jgi:P-type conjugative transfer protein TrbJ